MATDRLSAFASDFWNKKAPGEWSEDEVQQILNKSPWAKQVTAQTPSKGGGGGGGGGTRSTGNGGMGGMGSGTGRNSSRNPGMNTNRTMGNDTNSSARIPKPGQEYKGVVRWESAKPVLEARKGTVPEGFENRYVISLRGFPFGQGKNAVEKIKAASTLTPKGKSPAQADVAQVIDAVLVLGFPKDTLKLSPDDKEVAFATTLGKVPIKTKFTLKDMMYHENLAI